MATKKGTEPQDIVASEKTVKATAKKPAKPKAENQVVEEATQEKAQEKAPDDTPVTKEDIASIVAETMANLMQGRRVEALSYQEMRERYKNDDNLVIVDGTKAKTLQDSAFEEMRELKTAAKSKPLRRMEGTVGGFHKTGDNGIYMVDIDVDGFKGMVSVQIPVSHFMTMLLPDGYSEAEKEQYLINDLTGRIGSKVTFHVLGVDEKANIAMGTRLSVMQDDSNRNFVFNANDGRPRYVEDMIVPAKVIGVRRDRLYLDVLGVETTIKSAELSWTALDYLEKEFSVGDEFYVKIKEVGEVTTYKTETRGYKIVNLKVSKRECEKNPAELFVSHFKEGGFYAGVVKTITDQGLYFIRLNDKMDCLCSAPKSGVPMRGDHVTVIVQSVDLDKHQIYGLIKAQ